MEVLATPRLIERLVQEKRTGLYFKDPFEWTADLGSARRFDDLLSVLEACYDWNLKGVQLILKDLMANFEVQLDLDTA